MDQFLTDIWKTADFRASLDRFDSYKPNLLQLYSGVKKCTKVVHSQSSEGLSLQRIPHLGHEDRRRWSEKNEPEKALKSQWKNTFTERENAIKTLLN